MAYLVSNGSDVNALDLEGSTPLHLSIKCCDVTKQTRITKQLLFSGAQRDIKNKDGLKAIDFVEEV